MLNVISCGTRHGTSMFRSKHWQIRITWNLGLSRDECTWNLLQPSSKVFLYILHTEWLNTWYTIIKTGWYGCCIQLFSHIRWIEQPTSIRIWFLANPLSLIVYNVSGFALIPGMTYVLELWSSPWNLCSGTTYFGTLKFHVAWDLGCYVQITKNMEFLNRKSIK